MTAVDVLAQNILTNIADGFVSSIVFVALLLLGVVLAKVVAKVIKKISHTARIEESIRKRNLDKALLGFSITDIVILLAEIYIVLLAAAVAGDYSGLSVLSQWSLGALDYMASAVQGIILLVIGLFIAEYIANRIKNSGVLAANVIGIAVEVFIAYNALVLALPSLFPSADTQLLKDSFALLIVAIAIGVALAVGLGFGLGLKDVVRDVLKRNEDRIEVALFTKREKKKPKRARRR